MSSPGRHPAVPQPGRSPRRGAAAIRTIEEDPVRLVTPLLTRAALLAAVAGACTPGGPRAAAAPAPADAFAVLEWNEAARSLAASHSLDPPLASHLYALLSVAQHRALVQGGDAAVAGASAAVLRRFFPARADSIDARAAAHEEHARARGTPAEEVARESAAGRAVAARLLESAAAAEAATTGEAEAPAGAGRWASRGKPPLRPHWGRMRPWLLHAGDELRPPPPPEYGSKAFAAAVAEVRGATLAATPRQRESVHYWADGPGTATPPGHWNQIAAGLIRARGLDERRAARILAVLNAGLMDAGVACWDAKYAYWLVRPSHADTTIAPLVQTPNFPSYPSGHSYFSGAAAEILGHFFPAERRRLLRMAAEAAESRVVGGIHFRFDSDVGLEYGRGIGRLVVRRESRDPGLLLAP